MSSLTTISAISLMSKGSKQSGATLNNFQQKPVMMSWYDEKLSIQKQVAPLKEDLCTNSTDFRSF